VRRDDPRLQIITEAIERLIPGATPAFLSVTLAEQLPGSSDHRNTWTGSPAGLAERVFTALYGRPRPAEQLSPLERAEQAKAARSIEGEVSALMQAGIELASAPWYPSRPGDLVHIHYEQVGNWPAYGETYLVDDAGDGLMGLRLLTHTLLTHTLPDTFDEADIGGVTGCFATTASDEPLYGPWFEAGPHRLTIVRDGRPVHIGGAR
jgi:hypothetical protein